MSSLYERLNTASRNVRENRAKRDEAPDNESATGQTSMKVAEKPCPICGVEIATDSKRCRFCGGDLVARATARGETIPTGADFDADIVAHAVVAGPSQPVWSVEPTQVGDSLSSFGWLFVASGIIGDVWVMVNPPTVERDFSQFYNIGLYTIALPSSWSRQRWRSPG
jgi:hypothetical protein